jgi:hypothetical protein
VLGITTALDDELDVDEDAITASAKKRRVVSRANVDCGVDGGLRSVAEPPSPFGPPLTVPLPLLVAAPALVLLLLLIVAAMYPSPPALLLPEPLPTEFVLLFPPPFTTAPIIDALVGNDVALAVPDVSTVDVGPMYPSRFEL